jgi:predicted component of type VI protein secretion system
VTELPKEGAGLGRSLGTLLLRDETLSPLAATFSYRDGKLFVRDEGGPSGVLVRMQHQQSIEEGAVFSLGDRIFRFAGVMASPPRQGAAQSAEAVRLGSPFPADGTLLRLETLLLGGGAGRVYLLPAPLRIGRVEGDVLLPDDPFVSGRHCALHLHEGEVILQDLGSSNGTFLRIPPGQEHPLRPGDTLRVGRNILRVE